MGLFILPFFKSWILDIVLDPGEAGNFWLDVRYYKWKVFAWISDIVNEKFILSEKYAIYYKWGGFG